MGSADRRLDAGRFLAVVGATALLLGFGNGLAPWWPLTWLAPLPALICAGRLSWGLAAGAAFLGWLLGSVSLLPALAAVAHPALLWLASFGLLAGIFAAGVSLYRFLLLRGAPLSGTLALPALWVCQEWARDALSLHGTALDLAYTQLGFLPFLQLASLTGPWGMSFLLLWVPACVAAFLHLRTHEPQRAWAPLQLAGVVMLGVLGFGVWRLQGPPVWPRLTVGLIASDTAASGPVERPGAPAAQLLAAYAAEARSLASQGAQVIVLPEKLAVVRDEDQAAYDALFQPLADEAHVTLVVGVLRVAGEGATRYNRAYVYAPATPVLSYDKRHLLPPVESALTPGTRPLGFQQAGASLGVAICKDMDFTSASRAYGGAAPGLLLVPGWDFDVDRAFHGHMALMRGVEGGFAVARAGRNGLLTVSDNRGRVLGDVRSDSARFATLLTEVPVAPSRTLFLVRGSWFAWVAAALFALVLARILFAGGMARERPGLAASRGPSQDSAAGGPASPA
jgi:apolipoprotein N-acyltransferase